MNTATQLLPKRTDIPRWESDTDKSFQRQVAILRFIAVYRTQHSRPPSIRDMLKGIGSNDSQTIQALLARLRDKGLISWEPGQHRTITIRRGS